MIDNLIKKSLWTINTASNWFSVCYLLC